MKMEGIPFGTTDWESIPRTEHKGTEPASIPWTG